MLTLEKTMAELCGKEAALFVCTGTMGNQLCMRIHLNPLQEAILDARAHIYRSECGGVAYHTGNFLISIIYSMTLGASIMPITPSNGKYITAKEVESKIVSANNWHTPLTRVIALENTIAGVVIPLEEIQQIHALAKKYGLVMHLDGARIWNACVATGISLKEYGKYFDTMSICFSKGMGTPIGTVIVGTKEQMNKARHYRVRFTQNKNNNNNLFIRKYLEEDGDKEECLPVLVCTRWKIILQNSKQITTIPSG